MAQTKEIFYTKNSNKNSNNMEGRYTHEKIPYDDHSACISARFSSSCDEPFQPAVTRAFDPRRNSKQRLAYPRVEKTQRLVVKQ